ncbi:MAG: hypothetical protein Q4G23_02065, partial [Clostridia bacterium]|nr:hypothetical protein [Clostridia bacterium]
LADVEEFLDEELDEDEYDFDDEGVFIECTKCGDEVYVEFDAINDDATVDCPNCGEKIEIEFDCDCEDCEDCE